MRFFLTTRAQEDYNVLVPTIQKLTDKQIELLLKDLHYPSLRAKKYDESKNRWQARINRNYRFYFEIENDVYVIVAIIKHPK